MAASIVFEVFVFTLSSESRRHLFPKWLAVDTLLYELRQRKTFEKFKALAPLSKTNIGRLLVAAVTANKFLLSPLVFVSCHV